MFTEARLRSTRRGSGRTVVMRLVRRMALVRRRPLPEISAYYRGSDQLGPPPRNADQGIRGWFAGLACVHMRVRRARIASRTKLHQEVIGGSRKAETENPPVEGTKATPARRILWTGVLSGGGEPRLRSFEGFGLLRQAHAAAADMDRVASVHARLPGIDDRLPAVDGTAHTAGCWSSSLVSCRKSTGVPARDGQAERRGVIRRWGRLNRLRRPASGNPNSRGAMRR